MVDGKKTNEEMFADWLAENIPYTRLPELYLCYSEIEAYCLKTKVLHKQLFETTDLNTVKRVQKTVTENRIFQLSHKKQMKKIVAAARYYTAFVKTLDENAGLTEKPQNTQISSGDERVSEAVQEKEGSSNGKVSEFNKERVDFLWSSSFAYTKPISFVYFGDEQTDITNWTQLYVNVIACLSKDYPDEFLRMYNTNISGGRRIDFGTQKASEEMNAPKKVSDNFYVETNLSATDIVTKICILLDMCNVDHENLEIYYIKSEQTQLVEPELMENASVPPAREMKPMVPVDSAEKSYKNTLESFFESEKYELLYNELKKNGVTTIEELSGVNLWSFMNLHQLYSIQQRLAISSELTKKLRSAGEEHNRQDSSTYEIHYNGTVYNGASPSEAFLAFLTAIAVRFPLKFRTLLNVYDSETKKIVINRHDYGNTKLRLFYPEAYIDSDLSLTQVRQYIAWIIERCNAVPAEYTVEQKTNGIESSQKQTVDSLADNLQKVAEKRAVDFNTSLIQKAEDYLLTRDLTGAAYDELQLQLRSTMGGTRRIVSQSQHIIEMNKRLYHEEALVDLEEGADALEAVLDKLLKRNNGIATAKSLYEYACSEMAMFFNDNDIADQQSVYDLARYLFEKLNYHGKRYIFKSNNYISLPDVSADSVIDIVRKYAKDKGSTVGFKEIENYLIGLGLNTGSLRASMRIDKEPVFLIYAENEYLLAELLHIDAAFLESIHVALRRLFADSDGHIIPHNISDGWYNLLPVLPDGLMWTPMLLQQLIRFYPDELGARTIIAIKSQDSNTLHAMFVEKESWIQDFRDVVAVFLHDEMPNRCEFEAEELRVMLVDAGMISGNQLNNNMHNALGGDPRFIWNSEGSHVKVRM